MELRARLATVMQVDVTALNCVITGLEAAHPAMVVEPSSYRQAWSGMAAAPPLAGDCTNAEVQGPRRLIEEVLCYCAKLDQPKEALIRASPSLVSGSILRMLCPPDETRFEKMRRT